MVCCIFWELQFPEHATHTQRSPDRGLEEPDGLVKSVAMKGFPGGVRRMESPHAEICCHTLGLSCAKDTKSNASRMRALQASTWCFRCLKGFQQRVQETGRLPADSEKTDSDF